MSDETARLPVIHIDFVANGDFIHLRTDSGSEMAEAVEGFSVNASAIFKGIGDIKQAALANGVFSGNAVDTAAGSSTPSANTAPGETPKCPTHGPMKDMAGKRNKNGEGYKNRYYCSKFGCKDVQPQGEWVA